MNRTLRLLFVCLLQAVWAVASAYNLKVEATPQGACSLNTSGGEYDEGSRVYLRTYGHTGYVFRGWYKGDEVISSSASFYYTMPAEDVVLQARYEYDPSVPADPAMPDTTRKYALNVGVSPHGAGSLNTAGGKYAEGTRVSLRAYVNTGFHFTGWTDESGETLSTSTNFTYVMPGRDVQLMAKYYYDPSVPADPDSMATQYTVHVKCKPVGGGTFNTSSTTAAEGSAVRLHAYTNTGYYFRHWEDSEGQVLSTDQNFYYTIPHGNSVVYGVFEYDPPVPSNPARNYWNKELGEVIVDDFSAGGLGNAVSTVINGSSRDEVAMITVAGKMNDNDFGIANNYTNCTLLDLSRVTGITMVPSYAFDYTNLESVYLPASIENIGYRAFYECKQLSSLTVYAMVPPTVENYAFSGIPEGLVVYVPASSISQYQEAEGWKDFTFLPIQEDIRNVTVSLPEGTDASVYAQMWLELTNRKSGQRMHFVMTDRLSYTFANIIRNTSWNAVVRNQRGDVFGKIDAIDVADEDVTMTFESLLVPQNVTLTVKDAEGKDVTSDTQITWTDAAGNYLAQSTGVNGLLPGNKLGYTIVLSQNLAMAYATPSQTEYAVAENGNNIVCTLSPLQKVVVTGKVVDLTTRSTISGAVVSASQTFGGKYSKTTNAKTDSKGQYAMEVFRVPTSLAIAASDYVSQMVECDVVNAENDSISVSDVSLKSITGAVISLGFTYTKCPDNEGEEGTVESYYSDYNNVDYAIFNKAQNRSISQFNVQYPNIVLLEEVSENDILELTASSRTSAFVPVKATATIDAEQRASATFNIVGLGKLKSSFAANGNTSVVGSLYDGKGKLLKTYDYSGNSLTVSDLADGSYTLVTMGSSRLFNSIYDLSRLPQTGLVKDVDYVQHSVKVESGKLAVISIAEVPTLDESKLYYTGDNTSFTVNKSSIVAGNYLTLTGHLDFKTAYSTKVSNVNLIVDLPESCSFVENSVMVGNSTSSYTLEGNRVIIPMARYTDRVRFCIIPTLGGDYAPSALAQFDIEGETITQPIGSANYTAKDLSITVPETVARTTVTVSGTAMGVSHVDIYDNGVLIGQTTSLANGLWTTKCELTEAYNLSNHDIYAEVTTKSGMKLKSETVNCLYDKYAIEVKTVTMINTAHTAANLQLHDYVTVFDFQNPPVSIPAYWYWPSYPTFTFLIDFTNNDKNVLNNVRLNVFTDDGKITHLYPQYDKSRDKWVVSADFGSFALPQNVSVDFETALARTSDFSREKEEQARQEEEFCNHVWEWSDENMDIELYAQEEDADVYVMTYKELQERLFISFKELDYDATIQEMNDSLTYGVAYTDKGLFCTKTIIEGEHTLVYIVDTGEEVAYLIDSWNDDPSDENMARAKGLSISKLRDWLTQLKKYAKSGKMLRDGLNFTDGLITGLGLQDYFEIPDFISCVELESHRLDNYEEFLQNLNKQLTKLCSDGKPHLSKEQFDQLSQDIELLKDIVDNVAAAKNWCIATYVTQVIGSASYDVLVNLLGAKIAKGVAWGGKILKNSKNAKYFQFNIPYMNKIRREILDTSLGICIGQVFDTLEDLKKEGLQFDFNKTRDEFERFMDSLDKSITDSYVNATNYVKRYSRCPDALKITLPITPRVPNVKDPSGYVYEGVSSNRLEGVTATAYYKETAEDMYGDKHENIVKWDAAEYAQENPLFTDENGMYAWDVPNGLWQVKFEKEGYETTYSEWLPVPPPQLDINIPMKQNVQPAVKSARAFEDAVEMEFDKYMMPDLLTAENIRVMAGETAVEGTVELLNEEVSYEGNDEKFASRVRFNAAAPFDATEISLWVSNRVKSYAGIRMQDDFSQTFIIEPEVREIVCDSAASIVYGETGKLSVQVLPAVASAGKTLKVRSSSSLILSTEVEELTLDENGRATLTISGELPGAAAITYSIEGYDLSATTMVNIEQERLVPEIPIASAASGLALLKGTEVTLSCPTEGATIYYTIDGSCPCEAGAVKYDGTPITISEGMTLKIMAVGKKGNESEIATYTYTIRQTDLEIPMEKGWNWISHNRYTNLTAEELQLDYVERVMTQMGELYRDPELGFTGHIDDVSANDAIKANVSAECSIKFGGDMFNPYVELVTLKTGWNWIGYPLGVSLTVESALAGMDAEVGDYVVNITDGFSQYDGEKWVGTLGEMTPGKGYLLKSASDKAFIYNMTASDIPTVTLAKAEETLELPWSVDARKFPDVMCITGDLFVNDARTGSDRFAVAAFADGECCGIGEYADGQWFLMVHGVRAVPLTFLAADLATGEVYGIRESVDFNADVLGSVKAPFAFHLGEPTGVESPWAEGQAQGITNLLGQKVNRTDVPGIYIINGKKVLIRNTKIK